MKVKERGSVLDVCEAGEKKKEVRSFPAINES